jgi:hypothetical protein
MRRYRKRVNKRRDRERERGRERESGDARLVFGKKQYSNKGYWIFNAAYR